MKSVEKYIADLKKIYGTGVESVAGSYEQAELDRVPEAMREFYEHYTEASFPFGRIYPIEEAVKLSMAEPFCSEGWFCFGQDDYFSFWLCRLEPDEENLSFTYWDHEGGCGIGGAIDKTLVELLKDICEDWQDAEE